MLVDVVANLLAAAVVYLLGVAAGLLPASRWLTVLAVVVIVAAPVVLSDLLVDRGGWPLRRIAMGLGAVMGVVIAGRPWVIGGSGWERVWQGLVGAALTVGALWLLVSHLRAPWDAAASAVTGRQAGSRPCRGTPAGKRTVDTLFALKDEDSRACSPLLGGEQEVVPSSLGGCVCVRGHMTSPPEGHPGQGLRGSSCAPTRTRRRRDHPGD